MVKAKPENLRIVSIPKDAENGRPTDFMSGFFSEVLGEDLPGLQSMVLDCAHHAVAPKPHPGDRPRAIIIRLRYFSNKSVVVLLVFVLVPFWLSPVIFVPVGLFIVSSSPMIFITLLDSDFIFIYHPSPARSAHRSPCVILPPQCVVFVWI
ncbi:hypothetical protein PO909_033704 [Leuciscus waleckii]